MIQLAQELAASEPGRLMGLTVMEWMILLPFVISLIGNVVQKWKGAKDGDKLQAVIAAVEETKAAHPEAIGIVKRAVRDKATKLGVQVGAFGLKDDVEKHTKRLKRLEE